MTARRLGLLMMAIGVILVVIGIVGYMGDDTSEEAVTTLATVPTTDAGDATTTSTTSSSTTTAPSTTTSTSATTTTTTVAMEESETVEEFVLLFSAALESGDVEFVWRRLHPNVVNQGGEDLCRAWVENEIMGLSEYTLHEVTAGPATVAGIPDVYSAAVSFVFQGQAFDDGVGQYALVDGTFRWLGVCR